MRKGWILGIAAALCLLVAAAASAAWKPTKPYEFIAPAGPGGGVALAYIQRKKADPYTITVYSPPILLINLTGQTPLSYKNLTPIAMLIHDFGAFAVPKNSKYKNIKEVFEALKKDPKSVKIGGASSMGSMDHVQFLIAARAAGVKDLKSIQYIAFQGGESLAAVMGGHVDLLSTGMAELVGPMQSGDIRVLAVTSPKRIKSGPMMTVPTLREQGIDTEFINWRGIFGTPDMPADAKAFMADALAKMSKTPQWREICARNGWTQAYEGSAEFEKFLEKTNNEYKTVLQEVGLVK
jgi:putative tricarboxylic transport membrane protein